MNPREPFLNRLNTNHVGYMNSGHCWQDFLDGQSMVAKCLLLHCSMARGCWVDTVVLHSRWHGVLQEESTVKTK